MKPTLRSVFKPSVPGQFRSLLLFLVGVTLAACTPSTMLDWVEEVKLHDGRVILVKRNEELGPRVSADVPGGSTLYHHFCYAPLGVEWKSKPEYFPETFDIVDGKAYAKVTIANRTLCMLHGYPETDALYFVWQNNAWEIIDFKDFPKGLRYNMLADTHSERNNTIDVQGLVTLAEKEKRDSLIHNAMRVTEITGLNELPGVKGYCNESKGNEAGRTQPADIFLPLEKDSCKL